MTGSLDRLADDLRRVTGAHRVHIRTETTRGDMRAEALARAAGDRQGGPVARLDDGAGRMRFVPGVCGFTAFEMSGDTWRMG